MTAFDVARIGPGEGSVAPRTRLPATPPPSRSTGRRRPAAARADRPAGRGPRDRRAARRRRADRRRRTTSHASLVPEPTATHVSIDIAQSGVSTATCGPGVLPRYRLPARDASFALLFETV
ncbi:MULTISPECIES: hypothetical protein [Microbacterium]|uniref:hypothetical protein n=1 Tax=Microbacterium TaxID=33882 RepID=UPI00344FD117